MDTNNNRNVREIRKGVYDFIEKVVGPTAISPVLEIGPMDLKWTPIKEYYFDTKKYFDEKGIEYISCDKDPLAKTNICCDLLDIGKYTTEKYNSIIALEVLEHVSKIWEVPLIFDKLLNKGGKFFVSSPYYFYLHSPFPDYWRISKYGYHELFDSKFDITVNQINYNDDDRRPIQYTITGVKK
jgi:hypothetical protein